MSNGKTGASDARIHAIDYAKGALVLLMVVYHALNYLGYESVPHDYLRFVPSSFIMITGFLVWQVYAPRQQADWPAVALRLAVRALKLIALFTALNVAARLVWSHNRYGTDLDLASFFGGFASVYLTGEAPGVAFEVLLPIAYTLLLSIVLLRIPRSRPGALRAIGIAAFALCTLLDFNGSLVNTVSFLGAGVIGLALGSFSRESVDRYARSMSLQVATVLLCVAAFLWAANNYPAQILVTLLALLVLYVIGGSLPADATYYKQICLLGRYSLLSYVVQILYLQGTDWLLSLAPGSALGRAVVLTVVVALMTWLTVLAVEFARPKSRALDRAYRLVFA